VKLAYNTKNIFLQMLSFKFYINLSH